MTKVLDPSVANDLETAAEALRAGKLVAIPTETVYGLGANALDEAAVRAIFEAKGRPATNPLITHVASVEDARQLAGEWPETADALARAFWPGPLTLVVPRGATVPSIVTADLDSMALRVPNHPVALALLRLAGVPVAAPSANRYTEVSPTTAQHVLRGLEGRIPFVLDGGPTDVGIESTVLSLVESTPTILRPGMVTAGEIAAVIGSVRVASTAVDDDVARPSPGLSKRHYAPRVPLSLFDALGEASERDLVVSRDDLGAPKQVVLGDNPADWARELYGILHAHGPEVVDRILVQRPPDSAHWTAIADRLTRAAT